MTSLFAHPSRLWLLAFVPFLLLSVARGRSRRVRAWRALGQDGRLLGDGSWGWSLAVVFMFLALAQPRWGRTQAMLLPPGHDVIILVDASRSMSAEDAVPNRMGVAIESAESLVRAMSQKPGNRVAIVAFAGKGVTRCPLTENLGAAIDALHTIRPGSVRPGGTDLAAALDAAADAFDTEDHAEGKTIVIFSDGEDHPARWNAAAQRLRAQGIVVHTMAIGDSATGHPVPLGKGRDPLKFEGTPVLSKRNDQTLEAIARETGGDILKLGLASVDLGQLYTRKIAPIARRQRDAVRPPERTERYSLFVLAALVTGLAGSWPGLGRLFPRYPWFFSLTILFLLGAGTKSEEPARQIQLGRDAFRAGKFEEAVKAFHQATLLLPQEPIARYNEAAALYQLGRYSDAYTRYREARERANPSLRTKIDYVLGNTALALGDIPGAITHYDDCLSSTVPGSELDSVRRDAAINRQFAEERAKNPAIPPDPEGENAKGAKQQRPKKQPGDNAEDPEDSGPQADEPGHGQPPGDLSNTNRSGQGGAGGGGPNPPRPGSPQARLAAAIDNIKQARKGRLEEENSAPEKDKRDW